MPAIQAANLISDRTSAEDALRLDYLDLDAWQAFVERHPESTPFHHRAWIETIRQQYNLGLLIPSLKRGNDIQAAVPFLTARRVFGGIKIVGLPFTDWLPVLSVRPGADEALIDALFHDPPPCSTMSLRTGAPLGQARYATDWVRHEILLDTSWTTFSEKFPRVVRKNMRRASERELQFAVRTDADAMQEFYRLHTLTRQKLGVPVQPKSYYERLQKGVIEKGLGYLGVVTKTAKPVAAGIFLTYKKTVVFKNSGSLPSALEDRPNDFLVANALRVAFERGHEKFDFGISGRAQDGLRRFKSNWGAKEMDVYTLSIVGESRKSVDGSPAFKLASFVIRHSPSIVCRALGEAFYRFAI